MIRAQSLALYKNRPVLVLEVRDKIEILLEDESRLRVRDKDLVSLHPGPAKTIPAPAVGGDFQTARRVLADEPEAGLDWQALADLVFGASGPAEVLACWKEAAEGLSFRLVDGLPRPLGDEEAVREAERRARKLGEAAERSSFVERAKKARRKRGEAEPFLASDERYLEELEALALGRSAKSRLCSEMGIEESPESAHAFLLASGRWNETVNPHPSRSACPLTAPRLAIGPEEAGGQARVDLGGMVAWAIDNAWSKDPDDAIGWDGRSVWVHVSDPASAIVPDSPADKEALARGSTLYLPESISPMLSDEALERFGLGLSPRSSALSFRIEVAEDGSIAEVEVLPSIVGVTRTTYGEADLLLDPGEGQARDLAELGRVAELRRSRRAANGAVDIDIPEVRLRVEGLDRGQASITIEAVPETRSSSLVRELMLLAGEAAARWAFERSLPFPYYGQEAPAEGGETAAGTGLAAQFARRRLMRPGITGPTPSAHRGLGLPFYAQATSPLRRYQDLLGHMQIRAFLAGRPCLDSDEVGRRCALAQAASAATRQAERSSAAHWTLAWLVRNPGWEGEGIVVGAAGQGAWQVYIPSLGLETRMRLGRERALDSTLRLKALRIDLPSLDSSFDEVV
jgi:exoribonuclease-2